MLLSWDLSDVFLVIILEWWVFTSHCIKATYYEHDLSLLLLTLITVAELIFVRFLHCKVFFPSILLKNVIMLNPHLTNRKLYCTILRQSIYINYLDFFCIICLFFFINSIIYFLSAWTPGYLFYTLGCNPILL